MLGPDRTLVELEAVRLGGRWYTSAEALRRFVARLTPGAGEPEQPRSTSAPSAKSADDTLRRLGF